VEYWLITATVKVDALLRAMNKGSDKNPLFI